MYDNTLYFSKLAEQKSHILEDCQVTPNGYILATVHRDFNTDDPARIGNIFAALSQIADEDQIPIILPLHPRTRKYLPPRFSDRIQLIPPASFFDILTLEKNAKIVMTDSGGVQKEAFFFSRPCVILRPETEWVEILDNAAGILADADPESILSAYQTLCSKTVIFPQLFGDAHAASKILKSILSYLY